MATLKYFAQKSKDGYPVPSTMMGFKRAPKADTLIEIEAKNYAAAPGQSVKKADSGFGYFVRRKANGDIIPNSLFTSLVRPKGLVYEFKLITGTAVAAPSALTYTTPLSLTLDAAMTAVSPTVTGTVSSYAVSPALPAGLALNTTTGVISGTPTAAQDSANYTVTATNIAGSTTFVVAITIA
jgi:hypothetical protein